MAMEDWYTPSRDLAPLAVPTPATTVSDVTINPSQAFRGDQGASQLLGQLNRAQWEDWKTRFAPYITQLADYAQNAAVPAEAAEQASSAMGLAFDNALVGQALDRQGFGIAQTPAQQAAEARRMALDKSAFSVSAGNQARIAAQDRQMAVLAGGMGLSSIPDKVLNA